MVTYLKILMEEEKGINDFRKTAMMTGYVSVERFLS
jgi:hypothetical protein